jgi:hypothetical protein
MFRGTVTSYRVDRRRNEDIYDIVYEDEDKELLISHLQEEEELERLTLYSHDKRFTSDVSKTKHIMKWGAWSLICCIAPCA